MCRAHPWYSYTKSLKEGMFSPVDSLSVCTTLQTTVYILLLFTVATNLLKAGNISQFFFSPRLFYSQ